MNKIIVSVFYKTMRFIADDQKDLVIFPIDRNSLNIDWRRQCVQLTGDGRFETRIFIAVDIETRKMLIVPYKDIICPGCRAR